MNKSLLSLLHLTDPNLPIGGFSHSAGLETYVQQGLVKDKSTAMDFVVQMLSQNLRYTDAAFVSLVYDAAINNDLQKILELVDTGILSYESDTGEVLWMNESLKKMLQIGRAHV